MKCLVFLCLFNMYHLKIALKSIEILSQQQVEKEIRAVNTRKKKCAVKSDCNFAFLAKRTKNRGGRFFVACSCHICDCSYANRLVAIQRM